MEITIIGGGLAGSEAAWIARKLGMDVTLYEMKPVKFSPAHRLAGLSELVCSNSLKSKSMENSSGLLKEEMRAMGSLVIEAAEATSVPAGGALAVDREIFSEYITERITSAGIKVIREEVTEIPAVRPVIVATGPLTSDALAKDIEAMVGGGSLAFYDAVSPVVTAESIDMSVAFRASRYGKGDSDYMNCPMNEAEYTSFVTELINAERAEIRDFEDVSYFEGCLPVEVMAERGPLTLAFGPLKPVGFTDPRTGERPFAVVQLRMENRQGTLYNMVGFQTRLKYGEQKRVFSQIPGLGNAEFVRLGKVHRNSYLHSPGLLADTLEFKKEDGKGVFFAGQFTGVEGYLESAVTGIIAGINASRSAVGKERVTPPETTITGALLKYISYEREEGSKADFQPMNANFGLLPLIKAKKKDRKRLYAERALKDINSWIEESNALLKE